MAPKKGWKRPPFSEETRRKMSEAAKRRFADPEMHAAFCERQRTRKPFSDEARQRMSESGKRRYSDPEQREISRAHALKQWSSEEFRAKAAANRKPVSEEVRKKIGEASKRAWTDPAVRERQRQGMIAHWVVRRQKEAEKKTSRGDLPIRD